MAPQAFPCPEQAPRYGPTMVPVAEKHRKIRRDAPVKSTRCQPTDRKEIEILSYLDTPREFTMGDGRIETRKPTTRAAGKFYGVNASQVSRLRKQEDRILEALGDRRTIRRYKVGK
ncbi:hypothetical protein FN846DRAFT_1024215 [Sphaerosporella brunnea]|uniref:Uncharacterized protein n=1 Tax=Sphaerosporella brunnea TaxID=1250544 RepID=A0A5J5EJM8_9PEZI|nr:hypothetical protein FN846DRAFT_1024215 [Sphaerosporella brunnea]